MTEQAPTPIYDEIAAEFGDPRDLQAAITADIARAPRPALDSEEATEA